MAFFSDLIHLNNNGSITVAEIITNRLQNLFDKSSMKREEEISPISTLNSIIPTCLPPPLSPSNKKFLPGPVHRLLGASGRYPVFSPDERYIFFQRWRKGFSYLAMYDRKASEYRMLSDSKATYDDRHPSIVSHGGDLDFQIVFGTTRVGEERLYFLNLPQGSINPLPISTDLAGSIPTVTSFGRIIFAGYSLDEQGHPLEAPDLLEWNPEGNQVNRLTKTNWEEWRPVVTPDGSTVYFIANPQEDFDIFKLPYAGGDSELVYRSEGNEWDPDLSPDARWLVFASNQYGNFDLFLMDLSHPLEVTQLTSGIADDWDPRFLPKSNGIAFASSSGAEPFMFFLCPFGEGATN